MDHVEKYRLPKNLLEKEEEGAVQARDLGPGHAYKGVEFSNGYSMAQGQDLFAPVKDQVEPNQKYKKNVEEKQKRKEERKRKREEKEERRRRKEERRIEREEEKRKKHMCAKVQYIFYACRHLVDMPSLDKRSIGNDEFSRLWNPLGRSLSIY